jgi:hypothetical protein
MRLYALLTAQGTACAETVLTEDEYNDPARKRAVDSRARHTPISPDSPIPGSWADVSDNDVCRKIFENIS